MKTCKSVILPQNLRDRLCKSKFNSNVFEIFNFATLGILFLSKYFEFNAYQMCKHLNYNHT